jgi:hypothetical protein
MPSMPMYGVVHAQAAEQVIVKCGLGYQQVLCSARDW